MTPAETSAQHLTTVNCTQCGMPCRGELLRTGVQWWLTCVCPYWDDPLVPNRFFTLHDMTVKLQRAAGISV